MSVSRSVLGGLAMVLAATALVLSLAVAIGIWVVKRPAEDRLAHVFRRISGALTMADQGLDSVRKSLAAAAERLDGVKTEQRKTAQESRNGNTARRMMARTVQQRIAPEISNAHEKLHTVAEAAVVVNAVLADMENFPFLSALGFEVGDMTELNNTLTQVESSAWELGRLFVENESDAEATAQMSRIEVSLTKLQELLASYESKVKLVRQRTDEVQAKTESWATPVAIFISLAGFWVAVSQLCVLSRAWGCCRRNK